MSSWNRFLNNSTRTKGTRLRVWTMGILFTTTNAAISCAFGIQSVEFQLLECHAHAPSPSPHGRAITHRSFDAKITFNLLRILYASTPFGSAIWLGSVMRDFNTPSAALSPGQHASSINATQQFSCQRLNRLVNWFWCAMRLYAEPKSLSAGNVCRPPMRWRAVTMVCTIAGTDSDAC